MSHTSRRLSLRLPLIVGGIAFALCAFAFLASGMYLDWNSPKLINFLAAWIPFVLSVLFAFVPSGKEMKREWIKWAWRGAVVVIGFFWSVMLWHQQDLTDKANLEQTQKAIGTAVQKASDLAEPQFQKVRDQVGGVKDDLKKTESDIATKLDQSTSLLNAGLGKVGKPDPPEPARLRVSLWKEGQSQTAEPVESETIQPNADGSVTAQFLIRNISSTGADESDLWVLICDLCTYTKEPEGFERAPGNAEQERHIHIPGTLNPGAAFKVLSVTFRSNLAASPYGMGFTHSCKNCGKMSPEIKTLVNAQPLAKSLQ
jgi:hypothetical protein